MKNKRRKPTKRNSDIYWNILACENVGEKGYAMYETDIFKSNGIDRVVVYGKVINAKKIMRLINIVCSQIIEGDTLRSGITHTIIDDSIGKKIFEFGVRVIRYPTGETVMQLIPSFEYRNIV